MANNMFYDDIVYNVIIISLFMKTQKIMSALYLSYLEH